MTDGFESRIIRDVGVCTAVAHDYGGYVHRVPQGVIRPTDVEEVASAVRYARDHDLPLVARGAAHSTHGQSQVDGGLVLDLRSMNQVLELTSESMTVQGGASWRQVAETTLSIERTFPVFTDYLGATVGGTLSVGGVGSRSWEMGAQTDHVLALEVVTAAGDVVQCSPSHHQGLFDAVRCGLGQFAVITSAALSLVRAPTHAHYHRALYGDVETFLSSLSRLIDETEDDCVQGFVLGNSPESIMGHLGPVAAGFQPPAGTGPWIFCIETVRLLDEPADLRDTLPARGGWLPGGHFAAELPYLDYIDRLGPVESALSQLGLWQLPHPMLDLLLPGSRARSFLLSLLQSVDPDDVAGPVLIYPYRREPFQTPLFQAPAEPTVVLVGLMRTTLPPTAERLQAQLEQNRRLYETAVGMGGCYYPIDSLTLTEQDWRRQLGSQWAGFSDLKQLLDPHHLLNPGQEIFHRPLRASSNP